MSMIESRNLAPKPYDGWTLREKAAQLFVFGFHGKQPSDDILGIIERHGVGGVIYFTRNIDDARQVHELSSQLHRAASEAGRPPLLVSIDQEGGMVARIVDGVTLMPGNMALGAAASREGAYETARICGEELRLLGVNLNFAPCIDVNNNPDNPVINVRSYGDRPELVSELGSAAVEGFQSAGVAATVKHFPGHGDTSVDSHHALPIVAHDRQRLEEIELPPFRAAIAAGADVIMTAHVCLPALDPSGVPSTLSQPVLTGLLRGELGYDRVIVTDCLEMDAIDKTYGPGEGSVRAIEAGADLVLISHTIGKQLAGIDAVVQAVEEGRLSEERLEQSLDRILCLKEARRRRAPRLLGRERAAHRHGGQPGRRRALERGVRDARQKRGRPAAAAGRGTHARAVAGDQGRLRRRRDAVGRRHARQLAGQAAAERRGAPPR